MEVFPEYLGALTDLDYSLLMVMYIFAMQHYNKQCKQK